MMVTMVVNDDGDGDMMTMVVMMFIRHNENQCKYLLR